MRMWIIMALACGLLYGGFVYFKTIKFNTAVLVCGTKGPLKGLSFKVIDYKVSYNDLHVQDEFWDSKLGKAIFYQLSIALQSLVLASKKYVDVQFDVNYFGLIRRHYQVVEIDGKFDLISV